MKNKKKTIEKHDLHVKRGDRVVLVSGKDKGKVANVIKVITAENKVVVEGCNMITKAQKPNPMAGIQGGLIKKEAPCLFSESFLAGNYAKSVLKKSEIILKKFKSILF